MRCPRKKDLSPSAHVGLTDREMPFSNPKASCACLDSDSLLLQACFAIIAYHQHHIKAADLSQWLC